MDRNGVIGSLFGVPRVLVGVVHVEALPGTPAASRTVDAIAEAAVRDARVYHEAGFHGLMIENMHDRPYTKGEVGPEIVAAMTAVGREVRRAVPLPLGVQVLAGANREALAVAQACGARFVRVEGFVFAHVADEGLMESCAGDLLRYRRAIGATQVRVFADIKKKHASHAMTADVDLVETAHAAEFFLADGVVVTGTSTGRPADPGEVRAVSQAVGLPTLVGSGITGENISRFAAADAFIVGSSLKKEGLWSNPPEPARAAALVLAFGKLPPARVIPDLVVLGNLLVDDLVFPDGRTRMAEPGGATLYASLGANLWGLGVGVVSLRGSDYPVWALEALAERGVDLTGVHDLGGPGARTWLLYEEGPRQIVHRVGRPSHTEVSPGPDRIPAAWQGARAFHLAPMPLEVQRDIVATLSRQDGVLISLDPHVPLRAATMAAWGDVLAQVDVLFLGEDEMQLDHAREDPHAALRRLANDRLRLVLFKRGPRGGLAFDAREGRFHEWTPRAEQVVDPTGAGDALAGGFLAGCLNGDPFERALERGLVSASFAIADWGPTGLLDATAVEARTRLRQWCG